MPLASHKWKRRTFRSYKQFLGKKIIQTITTSRDFKRAGVSAVLSLQLLVTLSPVVCHGFLCPSKWALLFPAQQVDCDVHLTDCEAMGFYLQICRKGIGRVGVCMAVRANIDVLWAAYPAEVSSSPFACQLCMVHASPTMTFSLNALPPVHYEFKKRV